MFYYFVELILFPTKRYGVALFGIQTDMHGTWPIMLNPGPSYVLKHSDVCFYMNIAKEENSTFVSTQQTVSASQSTTSNNGAAPGGAGTSGGGTGGGGGGGASGGGNGLQNTSSTNKTAQPTVDLSNQLRSRMGSLINMKCDSKDSKESNDDHQHNPLSSIANLVSGLESRNESIEMVVSSDTKHQHHHHHHHNSNQTAPNERIQASKKLSMSNTNISAQISTQCSTQSIQPQSNRIDPNLLNPEYMPVHSVASTGNFFQNLRRKSSSLFSSDLHLDSDGKPRRDSSPTRLKKAVTGFASKVKRAATGRALDVPKIEFGSPAVKTNDVVAARGRRPSIAPVPAMLGEPSSTSESESDSSSESDSQMEINNNNNNNNNEPNGGMVNGSNNQTNGINRSGGGGGGDGKRSSMDNGTQSKPNSDPIKRQGSKEGIVESHSNVTKHSETHQWTFPAENSV